MTLCGVRFPRFSNIYVRTRPQKVFTRVNNLFKKPRMCNEEKTLNGSLKNSIQVRAAKRWSEQLYMQLRGDANSHHCADLAGQTLIYIVMCIDVIL